MRYIHRRKEEKKNSNALLRGRKRTKSENKLKATAKSERRKKREHVGGHFYLQIFNVE